ncbi:MAG TPA: DUF4383 domain-containing protein [Actinomycetota bacterium]
MSASSVRASEWTPARIFLLVSALYHLPLGILGLLVDQTFPLSAGAAAHASSGHLFGVFETNGWHSVAGLGVGAFSLFYVVRPRHARAAALNLGIGHVLIVIALAIWDPSTFLFASNGADQVIHTTTALGGIASGLLTPKGSGGRVAMQGASP